jgi:rubrerythrin
MAKTKVGKSDPVAVAIQMERDGMDFYTKASEQTKDPFGKRMFLSLVSDEKEHLKLLSDLLVGHKPAKPKSPEGPGFRARVSTIFKEATKNVKKKLAANPSDVEAVRIAMEMEERGFKFYDSRAKKVTDPSEKALFARLAKEENDHWTILEDTHLYMTDPTTWHYRENPPLLDGGP